MYSAFLCLVMSQDVRHSRCMGTTLQGVSLEKVMEDDFQMFKCLFWQEAENTGTCIGNKGRKEAKNLM